MATRPRPPLLTSRTPLTIAHTNQWGPIRSPVGSPFSTEYLMPLVIVAILSAFLLGGLIGGTGYLEEPTKYETHLW